MAIQLFSPTGTGLHWWDRFKKQLEDVLGGFATQIDANTAAIAALGPLRVPFAAKSANYTLTATDCAVSVDCSGGNRTVTLPAVASVPAGQLYFVKKIDGSGNTLTLDGHASETIDGGADKSTTTQNAGWTVISTGSGWQTFP